MKTGMMRTALLATSMLCGSAALAGPEVVAGPGAEPECFAPWSADTKYLQWPAKEGPYKIAIVNGFVGNTWRIQMIKTAKAYAEDPAVKDKIAEFKVVSTGTDAPAQLGAIEDFINQGYDAIVTIAVAPDGFDRVIRLADKNNVVLVPFDNVLDTDAVMQVNEDQLAMGRMWAEFTLKELAAAGVTEGKILEVRGLPGNSVDRDRSIGINEVTASGRWSPSSATGTTAPRRRWSPTRSPCMASSPPSSARVGRTASSRRLRMRATPGCRWPGNPRTASARRLPCTRTRASKASPSASRRALSRSR
jgi:ribose transport system substrate-binding protein